MRILSILVSKGCPPHKTTLNPQNHEHKMLHGRRWTLDSWCWRFATPPHNHLHTVCYGCMDPASSGVEGSLLLLTALLEPESTVETQHPWVHADGRLLCALSSQDPSCRWVPCWRSPLVRTVITGPPQGTRDCAESGPLCALSSQAPLWGLGHPQGAWGSDPWPGYPPHYRESSKRGVPD